jgi:hypothetical protein
MDRVQRHARQMMLIYGVVAIFYLPLLVVILPGAIRNGGWQWLWIVIDLAFLIYFCRQTRKFFIQWVRLQEMRESIAADQAETQQ